MRPKINQQSISSLCRMCNDTEEPINNIIVCKFSMLAQKKNKARHDNVAKDVHWGLIRINNMPMYQKGTQRLMESISQDQVQHSVHLPTFPYDR